MPVLTPDQLRQYASQAGFTGGALDTAVRIAQAESGGATHGPDGYNPTGAGAGSYDRGVLQINDKFWPQYSSSDPGSCAYDPLCAFKAAFVISKGGTDFTPWSTFNAGLAGPGVPSSGGGGGITLSTTSGAAGTLSGFFSSGSTDGSGTATGTTLGLGDVPVVGGVLNGITGVFTGLIGGLLKKLLGLTLDVPGLQQLKSFLAEGLKTTGVFIAGVAALLIGGLILAAPSFSPPDSPQAVEKDVERVPEEAAAA